jgi:hypothetical protein
MPNFLSMIANKQPYTWAIKFIPRVTELPAEDGLEILAGAHAVSGYRIAQHLCKGRPRTTLQILVNRTLSRLANVRGEFPSAEDVLNALEANDDPRFPIIDHIIREFDEIGYNDINGDLQTVTLGRFTNVVSEEKKEYSRLRPNVNS